MLPGNILVIGIGNEYRGDDGIGLYIAREIKKKNIEDVEVIEQRVDGAVLMENWITFNNVIVIDAISSDEKAGKIHRFNPHKEQIPSRFFKYSTHTFGLIEAIELSKTMGNLPKHFILFGIEGKNFAPSTALTREVKKSGDKVINLIEKEIQSIKELYDLKGSNYA